MGFFPQVELDRTARTQNESLQFRFKKNFTALYTNNLQNWDFGKEAHQNTCSERATIAERQGTSKNKYSEAKPTSLEPILQIVCVYFWKKI